MYRTNKKRKCSENSNSKDRKKKKKKKRKKKKKSKKKKSKQELHKQMASQKSLCEVKNYPMAWFHIGLQVQVLLYIVQSFCKFRYSHTQYSPFASSGTAIHCTVLSQVQVLLYTIQSFCKFRYCHTLYSPFANSGTAVHCTVLLQI